MYRSSWPYPALLAATLPLLAACSAPPPAPATSGQSDDPPTVAAPIPGEPAGTCNAASAQWAVGKALDEVLLERARVDAGAAIARSLTPDQIVTLEFNAQRLNVDVDADDVVTAVRCG